MFLIGGIFFNLGQMGANVLVEYKNVILIRGIFNYWWQFFSQFGAIGGNVLVEFENVF